MTRLPRAIGATPFPIFNRPQTIDIPDGLAQSRRPFFNRAAGRQFDIRDAAEAIEIDIYDEIGIWGVTARDVRGALKASRGRAVKLRINSPGGDVFDGLAIHNDLVAHDGEVEVSITGIAASAASVIAMAGDRIEIAKNAFLMIHNAWGLAVGDRNTMADMQGMLQQIDGALAGTYADRTGIEAGEVGAMMDRETWLGADEAVERGFADAISGAEADAAATARFDLSVFANTPDTLAEFQPSEQSPTVRDFERALRDAGYSRQNAKTTAARFVAVVGQDPDPNLRDVGDPDSVLVAAFERLLSTLKS